MKDLGTIKILSTYRWIDRSSFSSEDLSVGRSDLRSIAAHLALEGDEQNGVILEQGMKDKWGTRRIALPNTSNSGRFPVKLGVVGGGLRGLEMVYLARKAGIRTIVIDQVDGTPACSLADEVHICDLDTEKEIVKELLFACDAVIPAIEDEDACAMLEAMMHGSGIPLIYDRRTAHIGRSKVLSFKLMRLARHPDTDLLPRMRFSSACHPLEGVRTLVFTRVDDRKQLEKKIKNCT